MSDTHPIYHKPSLTCGRCHAPLVFPLRKDEQGKLIQEGKTVLAECNPCGIAVEVPAEMFDSGPVHHVDTTVARPWKKIV